MLRFTTRRRFLIPAGLVSLALAVSVTACGTEADSGTTNGTSASGADYSALRGSLQGSGATFPKAFYDEARAELKAAAPELQVEYSGGGSGKGKTDLQNQVVQWAGSDSTVKPEEVSLYKGGTFLYFPTVVAPITVSFNLSGVTDLQLSAETLAKIMQGDITNWNDAAIKTDNPSANLPDKAIVIAHRSDGSGTTNNFTKYLDSAAKGTWKLGSGDTVNWPAASQAGNGNAGVAQIVKGTDGAIGYVDFSDAKATGLTFAAIKNKDGRFVKASIEGASAAAAGAEIKDDLTYNPLNAAGADTYPITAPTYILVYQKQPSKEQLDNVKGWLTYLLNEGQELAPEVDFAPIGGDLKTRAVAQLDKLTN
jgi:phosphate transport system substrate-binding protein